MVTPLTISDIGPSPLCISRGQIAEITHINKFGRNPDCNQAASATAVPLGRSIWDGGIAGAGNWVEPTAPRIHQIVSTDTNDAAAGTGARTTKVFGLDSDYLPRSETIALNGTSNVPLVNSYVMIHRMRVMTAGTTGWNEGTITATADTDATVTAQITIGYNQTLMAIYMIRAKRKGYMPDYFASLHKRGGAAKFADIFLMSKELGGVWRIRDATDLASTGNTIVQRKLDPFKVFEPKELVQVIANPSADGQDISGGFNIILA